MMAMKGQARERTNRTDDRQLSLSLSTHDVEAGRFLEERNLLRLEPFMFFLDQSEQQDAEKELREAAAQSEGRRRKVRAVVEFEKGDGDRLIKIEVDAEHGLPKELAYRVLHAALYKLTRNPLECDESTGVCQPAALISFSKRELCALAGRAWTPKNDDELFSAIHQLYRMRVSSAWFDKETGDEIEVSFTPLVAAFFRRKNLSHDAATTSLHPTHDIGSVCAFRINPLIVKGYADAYIRVFNMNRLLSMRPLASVLYKRLFLAFCSVLDKHHVGRGRLRIEKVYVDICKDWLGDHEPRKYRSRISRHIGGSLDELVSTGLLRKWELKEARGGGFKITFLAGDAIHEDYENYYRHSTVLFGGEMPPIAAGPDSVMELLVYFHEGKCKRAIREFSRKEMALAAELLKEYTPEECRDLIDFTFEEIAPDYAPQVLGFVRTYVPRWENVRAERSKQRKERAVIEACPYCGKSGQVTYVDEDAGVSRMFPCPHDRDQIVGFIQRRGWQLPAFLR